TPGGERNRPRQGKRAPLNRSRRLEPPSVRSEAARARITAQKSLLFHRSGVSGDRRKSERGGGRRRAGPGPRRLRGDQLKNPLLGLLLLLGLLPAPGGHGGQVRQVRAGGSQVFRKGADVLITP